MLMCNLATIHTYFPRQMTHLALLLETLGDWRAEEGWRFTALNYYSSFPCGCLALILPSYHCSCSSYMSAHLFWPHIHVHAGICQIYQSIDLTAAAADMFGWISHGETDKWSPALRIPRHPYGPGTQTRVHVVCSILLAHLTLLHLDQCFHGPRARETAACCHGYLYLKPKGLTSRGMARG